MLLIEPGSRPGLIKMAQYNVHEAKSNLSKLLDRVEKGEIITLARNGKAIARIVGVAPPGLS
jgi:prevent-host-death family protein